MGNRFYKTSLAERFWPKVKITRGCWLWTGCLDKAGYGQINKGAHAGNLRAHRASWLLAHGSIPRGVHVLHRCDNPPCVRPSHLFLGNDGDNARDCASKGRNFFQKHPERHIRGDTHPDAKLSHAKVGEIIRRHAAGETQSALGKSFGVSQAAIWYALNGRTWRRYTEPARGEVRASETLF